MKAYSHAHGMIMFPNIIVTVSLHYKRAHEHNRHKHVHVYTHCRIHTQCILQLRVHNYKYYTLLHLPFPNSQTLVICCRNKLSILVHKSYGVDSSKMSIILLYCLTRINIPLWRQDTNTID